LCGKHAARYEATGALDAAPTPPVRQSFSKPCLAFFAVTTLPVHDARRMRQAGRELLSLALMDARNRTLRWLSAFEAARPITDEAVTREFLPALWLAGECAWFQEFWIARNVQRQRGEQGDPQRPKLASIDPLADVLYGLTPREIGPDLWHRPESSDYAAARRYMAETLDITLELLDDNRLDGDDALYFFRLALWREDGLAETLAVLAQAAGLPAGLQRPLWPAALQSASPRPALGFAGQRWQLGTPPGESGFVPDSERGADEVDVAAFEIDAQAVTWSQFSEFVEDGGYDEPHWWSAAGWDWVQQGQRRVPRDVEQLRHGVLLHRHGELQRVAGTQPAVLVSAHEADAWCRWAGRRLPTEAEWEIAVTHGSHRGLAWGDVWETVLGAARHWPDRRPSPVDAERLPPPGAPALRVQRGASWLTVARRRHPKVRRFVAAGQDALFAGFRSCAL
jgi:formylglycine-generating enzyme required for sulfatase activity